MEIWSREVCAVTADGRRTGIPGMKPMNSRSILGTVMALVCYIIFGFILYNIVIVIRTIVERPGAPLTIGLPFRETYLKLWDKIKLALNNY